MTSPKDIQPITYLKNNTKKALDYINETHRHMVITQNGEAKAILMDPESYEEMQNSLQLLKILSFSEQDIKEGKISSQEKVFKNLEKKYFK